MSAHRIVLDYSTEAAIDSALSSVSVGTKQAHDVLDIFVSGQRRRIHNWPRRHRFLLLGLFGVGATLLLLYAYWNNFNVDYNAAKLSFGRRNGDVNARNSNETLGALLEREVRVLCWVMTTPSQHKTKAIHLLRTWGKRCTSIYFVTSQPDDELPTIVLDQLDKYEVLWGKTKAALKYIYENLRDEADWFMKADDDTYTFVDNMRYMLYPYSTDWPIYFGFNFKLFTSKDRNASYMSGGSGYILSREALRRFVVVGLPDGSKCRQADDSAEDVEVGNCLRNVGVMAGDSRDALHQHRFQPFAPYTTLISHYNGMDFWYFKYSYYNPRACIDCLSEYPVAFHYVSPEEQYVYEYFNYEFETYGLAKHEEVLPLKLTFDNLIIPESDNT